MNHNPGAGPPQHHPSHPSHPSHPPQPQRPASTTPLERFVYQPSSTLFDEDPGIMSEIETSATGFRRGNKARASLPIVRTPSKTQDRSLGLVFLQFRAETKRALLPNEITSLDTVKALFVRSFPRQLSMEYLDCPSIRIYIHDGSKDMFYELEDFRDIRDRCVLRIYEHGVNGPQPVGGHANMPNTWSDCEQFGYFSEPEFESEYQSQHIHRGKRGPVPDKPLPTTGGQSQYYGTIILPAQYRTQAMVGRQPYGAAQPPQPPERSKPFPGYSQTLPRNAHIISLYGNVNDANTNNVNQNQSPTQNSVAPSPTQRSVSPDLIQKQRPKDPIG
ncbi:unnamed protein product [Oppiella nova]|uniref:Actin interacting protein 3-like C-terminal domain-containing protein n=1 Tax=Oppiella nova TaxID=334625 RepID=A0A7R9QBC9_9ACAR|nr:unnamed protein product [Oppiella nova]CAG2162407.1 unnamed protein product [Oppiella nova]